MMNNTAINSKRLAAFALAAAMVIPTFTSCGRQLEQAKLTNVFKETIVDLPREYAEDENFYIQNIYQAGENIYAWCNTYDMETYESEMFFLPLNADGSIGEKFTLEVAKEEGKESYIQSQVFTNDGGLWAVVESYSFDPENGYMQETALRRYDDPKSGEFIEIKLDMESEDGSRDFYINYMVPLSDGSLLVGSWQMLKIMSPDGTLTDLDLELPEGTMNSMGMYYNYGGSGYSEKGFEVQGVMRFGDIIYISVYCYDDKGTNKTFEFDEEKRQFGKEAELPGRNISDYNTMSGPGYDYYYRDNVGIWGCNIGKDKVEVFNFINSDINVNNFQQAVPITQDKFLAIVRDPEDYRMMVALYDRIPDEQVAQRQIITLAVARLNSNLRNDVIAFNKSSDEYRIMVTDYSIYRTDDNYNAGIERLNNDIISGQVPDILLIDTSMPYDSYVAKGLFADLYELMDADPEFNRDDYLTNIFEAYEVDGKLYSLVPTFQLQTFAAKTELLDGIEHWTIDEFMEFVEAHPDLQIFDDDFNQTNFLQYMILFGRDTFVDRETGECRFEGEEFRSLMEFAKSLSKDSFWENFNYDDAGQEFWDEYDNRFIEGRVLLTMASMYNVNDSYKNLLHYTLKDEFEYVGFPSDDGNGAIIYASNEYCISRRSQVKEGAWEFLKSFISEDELMPTQSNGGYWRYPGGIPILRSALDKQLEIAMTPPKTEESEIGAIDGVIIEGGAAVVPSRPGIREDPYSIPLTEEQCDQIMALIEGVTQVSRTDDTLISIINEEAAAYFEDQKDLDTVLDIIQNRAEIYIAESR